MSFLINVGFVASQFTKGAERGLAVPLVTFIIVWKLVKSCGYQVINTNP